MLAYLRESAAPVVAVPIPEEGKGSALFPLGKSLGHCGWLAIFDAATQFDVALRRAARSCKLAETQMR